MKNNTKNRIYTKFWGVASTFSLIGLSRRGKRKLKLFVLSLSGAVILFITSCNKMVEVPPPSNSITGDFVFTTNASSISVLTEMYSSFNRDPIQGLGAMPMLAGLAADEYKSNNNLNKFVRYSNNALTSNPQGAAGSEHWAPLYNCIFPM